MRARKDSANSLSPIERQSIATQNLGLVRSIANGYSIGSTDPYTRDDLVNQGVLGLMRGIQLCSFTGGTTYSTFLGAHIHGAIRYYLRRQRHLICPSKGKPPYIIQRVAGMDDGDCLIESIAVPKSSSEDDDELLAVIWAVLEVQDEKTKLIVQSRAKGSTLEQSSAAAKCCYKTTVRRLELFKQEVIRSI
jgi:RNA polymerase sigma factor (sigma-70 family)